MTSIDSNEMDVHDLGEAELRHKENGVAIPVHVFSEGSLCIRPSGVVGNYAQQFVGMLMEYLARADSINMRLNWRNASDGRGKVVQEFAEDIARKTDSACNARADRIFHCFVDDLGGIFRGWGQP